MDNIFKDNPGLDVAYKTADGKYFYTENGAQNHALTLKNQEVKKVVRPEEGIEKEGPKTVTTTQPSDISENSESTDTSETSKEEPKTVATTQPSDISENSENSNVSETLEPLEEENSEETKPNLELKSNKQNKR